MTGILWVFGPFFQVPAQCGAADPARLTRPTNGSVNTAGVACSCHHLNDKAGRLDLPGKKKSRIPLWTGGSTVFEQWRLAAGAHRDFCFRNKSGIASLSF